MGLSESPELIVKKSERGRRLFGFQVAARLSAADEKMGTAGEPDGPAVLRLRDFEGDFSADDFIHSILESAGLGGSGPGSSGGFDAERMLAALDSGGAEVAALRVEAQGLLRVAVASEELLVREHAERVRALRRQADQVLFFFLFFTLVTGPRRSLILKLSDTRVYGPQIRARLGTTAHSCEVVVLKLRAVPV